MRAIVLLLGHRLTGGHHDPGLDLGSVRDPGPLADQGDALELGVAAGGVGVEASHPGSGTDHHVLVDHRALHHRARSDVGSVQKHRVPHHRAGAHVDPR